MATYGRVEPFYEDVEIWDAYVERLDQYFVANDVTENAKKRSILLSVCGAKTYNLVRNLCAPVKPADKSYDQLTELLKQHYNPRPSVIVQRFKFNSRVRQPEESVADFVADLRRLSEHCEYQSLDEMLRARLVCGINDNRIQRRLLSEADLTFKQALQIAMGMELAEKNVADIQQEISKQSAPAQPVHKIQPQKQQQGNDESQRQSRHMANQSWKSCRGSGCFRCGGNHEPNTCRWRNEVCHRCSKRGHIARKCQQKKIPHIFWRRKKRKILSSQKRQCMACIV